MFGGDRSVFLLLFPLVLCLGGHAAQSVSGGRRSGWRSKVAQASIERYAVGLTGCNGCGSERSGRPSGRRIDALAAAAPHGLPRSGHKKAGGINASFGI